MAALEGVLRMTHRDYRTQSGPDAAFRLTRAQAEEAGVFVLLMGNLGSYHTNLEKPACDAAGVAFVHTTTAGRRGLVEGLDGCVEG